MNYISVELKAVRQANSRMPKTNEKEGNNSGNEEEELRTSWEGGGGGEQNELNG